MNYKVGDRVRIRKDLKAGKYYGELYCNSDMASMSGKVVTIGEYIHVLDYYTLSEDANKWRWSAKMFEGLAEDIQEKTVKLYTQQDLRNYELLLNEKLRVTNDFRMVQIQRPSTLCKLHSEYLKIIQQMIDNLGHDVSIDEAKKLGINVGREE